ncbi:MAG: hypothetical protein ACFCVK_20345 [Acidimicrobiales bacterium]
MDQPLPSTASMMAGTSFSSGMPRAWRQMMTGDDEAAAARSAISGR